jgi:hypothetical protein
MQLFIVGGFRLALHVNMEFTNLVISLAYDIFVSNS